MSIKQVYGIWLPEEDQHFEEHFQKGDLYRGAGSYQLKKIEMALARVPLDRRAQAVDVGAHVGLWSRVLADNFIRVDAFEPFAIMRDCFKRNISDRPNVHLHPYALSNTASNLLMVREAGNSGNSRVATGMDASNVEVPSMRLDDWTFEAPIGLLKIDVEGWEEPVVRGGLTTILSHRPIIVVEQKPGHAERYGFDKRGAVEVLLQAGAVVLWERAGDVCLGWNA